MKNNYFFLISVIMIVIIWSAWYYVLIEPMDTNDQSAVTKLQEIMESFSKDVAEKMRNLIFTKTAEGEEVINKNIAEHEQQLQYIADNATKTNEELQQQARELIDLVDKMIIEEQARQNEFNANSGVAIEILEQSDKVRSIVNKYID
jgi:GTPase involved in cell partitioning and DNA repair